MPVEEPNSNPPPSKPLSFGILSLALPFLGVGMGKVLALSAGSNGNDSWGLGGAIILILSIFLSLFSGIISASVGIVRGEKNSYLSWLGLLLNASILFYVMTYDSRHHHN